MKYAALSANRNATRLTAIAAALAAVPTLGLAQSMPALEEVVVVAQKREQSLQEVPVAVTAFSSEALDNNAVLNLNDLNAMSPNVILQPAGAFPNSSAFAIRGITTLDVESTAEPTVGVVMDGVNIARNVGALLDLFDVQQVEVLRGPQGTLYGGNNIGGLINVTSKRPSGELGGAVKVAAGSYGLQSAQAYLDTPTFGDSWSAKVSVGTRRYDGVWENPVSGADDLAKEDVKTFRGTLQYEGDGLLDAVLIVDHVSEDNGGGPMANVSLPGMTFAPGGYFVSPDQVSSDPHKVPTDVDLFSKLDTTGAALEANLHLDSGTVTSVTGWRATDNDTLSDFDGSAAQLFTTYRDTSHEQLSQEIRFASELDGDLNYVAGVYYFWQEFQKDEVDDIYPFFVHDVIDQQQESTTAAVFAQADYLLTDRQTLTLGGRYSQVKKDYQFESTSVAYAEASDTWNNFSGKLGWNFQYSDELMYYASWTQGFRSGGYTGRPNLPELVSIPTDDETVDSYELGLKSDWFNKRLRLNMAAFYNDYTDLQVATQIYLESINRFTSVQGNVGGADIYGLEAELEAWATDNLRVMAAVGLMESEYKDFYLDLTADGVSNPTDQSHFDLPNAPETTASLTVEYRLPVSFGTFTLNGRWNYTSEMLTTTLKDEDIFYRDTQSRADASVAFEDYAGRYRLALWGKNLTDEVDINNSFAVGSLVALQVAQPGTTYGVDFTYNF
ncbi:TonB-dependent receptor [Parahaliea maris]|uniref:TonB-dependent receptor n=1 Tax=Parahaliea maris TaxID=2716870 RepID=A0A5C8ZLS4_9GAMM|nr:TonB-dependent receptor [Parahaliea maris]TXS89526.1 TonB-dependent receptor [Parahaliea maris]